MRKSRVEKSMTCESQLSCFRKLGTERYRQANPGHAGLAPTAGCTAVAEACPRARLARPHAAPPHLAPVHTRSASRSGLTSTHDGKDHLAGLPMSTRGW